MKNVKFYVAAFSVLACSFGKSLANDIPKLKSDKKVKPRNVIFILTDDHRYDYMGFTGKVPWLETPHLDQFAKEGAYFKNAFVTTSLCSPSRASILTGQYSHVHTMIDNFAPNPGNLIFFPQYLQKA
ncbi:MAG: sulfatase-like hydrolase/transferase, partial [Spirochaetales bacterium]|nr:sulfatase-like hydrolase/transferase [Spirochaetales bacterium]